MSYFPASSYSGMGAEGLSSPWGRQAELRYWAKQPMTDTIEWWHEDGRVNMFSQFLELPREVPYCAAHRAACELAGHDIIGSNSWA